MVKKILMANKSKMIIAKMLSKKEMSKKAKVVLFSVAFNFEDCGIRLGMTVTVKVRVMVT